MATLRAARATGSYSASRSADSDSPGAVVAKVEALGDRILTTDVSADPKRTTALLGYTVGIGVPGYDFARLEPGWDRTLAELAPSAALLPRKEPLAYALEQDGWRPQHRARGLVLLLPPAP